MSFEFKLEGLLRVRESFERREEQKLAVAFGELKHFNAMLDAVRERLASLADGLGGLLVRGMTAADLHLRCLEILMLERRERALAESVAAALTKVQNQQRRLQEAKQKRQVLDKLRQKQLMSFLLSEGRRDQQKLDDAFLLRRSNEESGKGVA